ncbi:MAG: hypothetical protein O7F76_01160, partial [Planctomycetota bacterium]|nr:hypothetical protein [Planctomycetota bacterium]
TIWIGPHGFGSAYGLMLIMEEHLLDGLMCLSLSTILTIPVICPQEDRVFLVPLIPGYHWQRDSSDEPHGAVAEPGRIGGGIVVLSPNGQSPSTAHPYWDEILQRLRRRFEPTRFKSGPDLRLNHYHYPRVKAFIQRELQRIEPIKTKAKPTTRSTQQRGSSLSPESDSKP